ncbi:MAG: hypothetical protein WC421_01680 [Elusimicrobiales bacterium]
MRKLIAVVALSVLPVCGASAYFDGGLGGVSGADSYSGFNAFAEVGMDNFYVRPAYGSYKSDATNKNTYSTYSARVGYEKLIFALGLEGGTTPKKSNGSYEYGNNYISGDITFSVSPTGGRAMRLAGPRSGGGGAKGEGLTRVDFGASLTRISHDFSTLSDKVGETDGSVFAGVMFLGTQISAKFVKNLSYSQDITGSMPVPMTVELPGTMICTQGYINQALNARVDFTMLPLVTPFISYTATQYKGDNPLLSLASISKAYMLGATVGLDMLNINAAYQIFDPGVGHSSTNYFSLGAGLKF